MPTNPDYLPQSSVPPMGLVVLPSGLIVYQFEGVITATGLFLPEAVTEEGEEKNRIGWRDPSNLVHSIILAAVNFEGNKSILEMIANATAHREKGTAVLGASDGAGVRTVLQVDTGENPQARVITPNETIVLVRDGLKKGESSFLRYIGEVGKIVFSFGVVQVEWVAKGVVSAAATVTHELNPITPGAVIATGIGTSAGGTFQGAFAEVEAVGASTFKTRLVNRSIESEIGTKAKIAWLAVGIE